jgi:hypothetical protein
MRKDTLQLFGRSFAVLAVAALAAACAGDVGDNPANAALTAPSAVSVADESAGNRFPDLSACPELRAPAGSTLLLHAFGIGVQIYHWNGTSWGVAVPSATLYADEGGHGKVATHFAGPTWRSNSGSTVVGTVAKRCTPDSNSIPWLSLTAAPDGAGIFATVTFIQRLKTVGGNPPSTAGTVIGQEARIPYTADYLFYRAP